MALIIKGGVKESSTTIGTSAFALGGAVSARYRTFGSQMAIGDTCFYTAYAVDGNGVPTGDFESGIGTYSATNTLTRTSVDESSNGNALVNFAAGTKYVFIDFPAQQARWVREKLTADRTYYVSTTGSDSNDGLTSGKSFATIQKAVDTICDTLDLSIYKVTIQVADGTYTGAVVLRNIVGGNGGASGAAGAGVTIQGNSSSPANVVISTTSASCFGMVEGQNRGQWYIKDMKLQTTTSGFGILANSGGIVYVGNLVFGACANGHLAAVSGCIRFRAITALLAGLNTIGGLPRDLGKFYAPPRPSQLPEPPRSQQRSRTARCAGICMSMETPILVRRPASTTTFQAVASSIVLCNSPETQQEQRLLAANTSKGRIACGVRLLSFNSMVDDVSSRRAAGTSRVFSVPKRRWGRRTGFQGTGFQRSFHGNQGFSVAPIND